MRYKFSIRLPIIINIFILVLIIPAYSDYHYASHTGNNTYPYTSWETAADSIQKAVDASSPHDTVYVGSGHWYEAVVTGMYDSVSIVGMGWDSTFCHYDGHPEHFGIFVIDYGCAVYDIAFFGEGMESGIFGMPEAGITISGCRFSRCQAGISNDGFPLSIISDCIFDSCQAGIFQISVTGDIIIRNNLMLDMGGTTDGFAIIPNNDRAVVENNIIIVDPPEHTGYSGIVGAIGTSSLIRNNLIRNAYTGISVSPASPEPASDKIYNNTVLDSYTVLSAAGIWGDQGGDSIINNLVSRCRMGIIVNYNSGPSLTFNYNCLWDNFQDFSGGQISDSIGNIYSDPMLVNPDSGDFRLQAYSPLIDAGDPSILDVDGTRSDIGCYGGPGGRFYEYLDLSPQMPDSVIYRVWNDTIYINWRMNTEADFAGYLLYRETYSGFIPSPSNLLAEPDSSFYNDGDVALGQTYYYRIAALDNQGNLSAYCPEIAVVVTGLWSGNGAELPRLTTIEESYPNPFNSATTIVYSVANLGPVPAQINIDIYDVGGRKVKTLIDERKEVGIYKVTWNGKGDDNLDVPSGIYFARISQWGQNLFNSSKKMTIVR